VRVAVIGSGIAGLATAWLLSRKYPVTVFEADDRLGGHTHTHNVEVGGRRYALDTGFLVHNPRHYPLLTRLFEELGVASQASSMSFSVRHEASGREYNAATLDTLFCQRRNLVSAHFLGMVRDLLRFYREAPALLQNPGHGPTLGEYLLAGAYGAAFRDEHLVPMASALWSSPAADILRFPARYLVQFMANHQMLQLRDRPAWRVVRGGSASYIKALSAQWRAHVRLSCGVQALRRLPDGVEVTCAAGTERFEEVVLACHADTTLTLLRDASDAERAVLGAIRFQDNDTVLHTDASVLPRHRKARAAWNALVPRTATQACTVSYCLNLLQGLDCPLLLLVTLNGTAGIDPAKVLRRMHYRHPLYSHASVAARARKAEIQGRRHTWFAGAYWGWGFHEDGMRSAVEVATALGVSWPVRAAAALLPAAGALEAAA
jgi:predicted NAD/FAD-binding protein